MFNSSCFNSRIWKVLYSLGTIWQNSWIQKGLRWNAIKPNVWDEHFWSADWLCALLHVATVETKAENRIPQQFRPVTPDVIRMVLTVGRERAQVRAPERPQWARIHKRVEMEHLATAPATAERLIRPGETGNKPLGSLAWEMACTLLLVLMAFFQGCVFASLSANLEQGHWGAIKAAEWFGEKVVEVKEGGLCYQRLCFYQRLLRRTLALVGNSMNITYKCSNNN